MSLTIRSVFFRVFPWRRTLALTLVLGIVAPAAVRADGMIIPFYGVNFGGSSGQELGNAIDAERYDWGVSFAFMGAGVLGLEADIARSPDFFGRSDIGGSSVFTATGNLLFGIPIGGQEGVGFRPYALVGLGVIRSKVDAFGDVLSLDNSKAAFDFGGGAMFFFGDHFGVRGDIRYFRTFSDVAFDVINIDNPGRLNFTRGSAGLVLRF
jgi:opacity protein-like surface antigen